MNKPKIIDIVFKIMRDFQGREVPSNTELQLIYGVGYSTIKGALDKLKEERVIINDVVENGLINRG